MEDRGFTRGLRKKIGERCEQFHHLQVHVLSARRCPMMIWCFPKGIRSIWMSRMTRLRKMHVRKKDGHSVLRTADSGQFASLHGWWKIAWCSYYRSFGVKNKHFLNSDSNSFKFNNSLQSAWKSHQVIIDVLPSYESYVNQPVHGSYTKFTSWMFHVSIRGVNFLWPISWRRKPRLVMNSPVAFGNEDVENATKVAVDRASSSFWTMAE